MAKIRVLLLTGQNNHDWRRSSAFIDNLLTSSGHFEVLLCENASATLEDAEGLKAYDVFFVDYNGPDWSREARHNFEAAVRRGTGVVALHAANNPFRGWTAYEEMLGLMWREDGGHGQFHEFEVKIADPHHPITRGVPNFSTWDELYHNLTPTPGAHFQVLATAYSDPAQGGSGKDEPMMLVNQFGRGRIFHQILGHVWPGDPSGGYKGSTMIAFESPWFQKTLVRGCSWAAAGSVPEE